MGFPHGFNTRILQIAAIVAQIELCEQELLRLEIKSALCTLDR